MDISVIVPVYNAEKTINRTLKALKSQTYSKFEVLLIDNGSIDRSAEICLKYQQKDARFRYIYTEQKGVSIARNIGITYAVNEYICFCDADDIPAKDMLQILIDDIKKFQSDCVMCNYYTERDRCNSIFPTGVNGMLDSTQIRTKLIPAMFSRSSDGSAVWGTVWRCIFKKSIIQNIKLKFDLQLTFAEDLCFVIEYLSAAGSIYLENKVLYHYSMTDGSAMLSFNRYKPYLLDERIYLIKKISVLLKKINIYEQLRPDVETIFQEYILECIGNAAIRHEDHNFGDCINTIQKIVSDACVKTVFSTIYTKNRKHKIVFKMIKYRMSIPLVLYYSLRRRRE